jgi:hypothetical protein
VRDVCSREREHRALTPSRFLVPNTQRGAPLYTIQLNRPADLKSDRDDLGLSVLSWYRRQL